jgi:hypothetical protein
MTAPEIEPPEEEPATGPDRISYEGSRVPLFIVVLWAAFFIWGVFYLVRWIPDSWREWFSR